MKNVTTKGFYWVGVPIILTANSSHKYLQQESHIRETYHGVEHRKHCEELESHRRAF